MNKDLLLELYKSQSKIIYKYLIKCGCPKEDAEDIVQDSFIKALEYMEGVSINNLSSWLFKVSINNYKNKIKKRSYVLDLNISEEVLYANLILEENLEQGLLSKEKSEAITQCLNSLKEESRTLLILKYELELSYKEISRLLGLSEDMIKTYLYRARNMFKEIWRDKYGEQ
ncbi:RNA polymerase sigma factor [Desnuesiella massiliensis]|uniref:RNA polymerase sigma factor n=1 Tax=Desnuesiella massiliensis TaxID=1650662 RepID=UPI0006E43821|nr:RNA polymerase sigma factor [Desnuesiella massiliensis]